MTFELGIILKAMIVLSAAGLLTLLMKRASASARHSVWIVAFWAVLALPVVSKLLPAVEVPVLPRYENPVTVESPISVQLPLVISQPMSIPMSSSLPPRIWTWRDFVVVAWGAGALALLVRALSGFWGVRRLRKRAMEIAEPAWTFDLEELRSHFRITSRVGLLASNEPVPPMTWGVFSHTILMPQSARSWSARRFRSVLAHELAHVKRRDGLTQILAQVVCTLYWFNPLVWYAAHRLRIERERACDDGVLDLGVDADDYADHLLQIAREVNGGISFGTVSMAHPSQLESRLLAILDRGMRRQALSGAAAGILFASIAFFTVSVAVIQLTALASLRLPVLTVAAPPAPQLVQAPTTPVDPLTAGRIQGRVVRAGTNEGLSKATVELILADVPALSDLDFNPALFDFAKTRSGYLSATTNDRGEFAFDKVAPGHYRIESRRDRFALASSVLIEVQATSTKRDVTVPMSPAAAITGIVRDENEKPVAYAVVTALGLSHQPGRGKHLHIVETVETNDLGEYRLFGLSPGDYYVSVDNSDSAMHDPMVRRQNVVATEKPYPVFYYPDTPQADAAKPVRVRDTGLDVGGIDIRLKRVPMVAVRGVVQTATAPSTAGPLPPINLMFTPASFMDAAPGYRYQPDSAGKFEIKDVPPGSYLLMAWGLSRNGPSLHSPMMRVDVGATDIEGLVVPVVLGPTVSGRIQIDGSGSALPFDATGVVVKFRGRVGQGVGFFAGDSFTGNVNPDGSYSTARGAGAFPGEFDVTVQNLPPGFYLKSPLTLQIPANEVPPSISLDLILARHQGVTSGTVTRGPGRPAAGAKVVLVPVEALQRRADRFPRASTDSEGKFRIVSAPPGDYTAYAFEDIEAEAQYSSEFLQTYVGRGSRVSIVANSDVSLNLQLIPKEAR